MNSVVYDLPGSRNYPAARQGGLSRLGHIFNNIENIYVLGDGLHRILLIHTTSNFTEEEQTELSTTIKGMIPVAEKMDNFDIEANQMLLDSKRKKETGVKCIMFFDRATFV